MNSKIAIKKYKTCLRVTYYTLQYADQKTCETDKFFDTVESNRDHTEDVDNMVKWLFLIGNERGAQQKYFRREDDGVALPPYPEKMQTENLEVENVRLYCIRISKSIVILGNGGIKTARFVRDCPNCKPHFEFINSIARQIKKARIKFQDKVIEDYDKIYFEYEPKI